MKLREWMKIKIAEVFAFDVVGMGLGAVLMIIFAIFNRELWPGLVVFAFFAGSFYSRLLFTPVEKKVFFGLKYISEEELEEIRK